MKNKIYFKITFCENRFFLDVVGHDKKTPVDIIYFDNYPGNYHQIFQEINSINEENFFEVDWDNDGTRVDLSKENSLVSLMMHCDNVIDENGNGITFDPVVKRLSAEALPAAEGYQVRMLLDEDAVENAEFINDEYCIVDNRILRVAPIGKYFDKISSFFTNVTIETLDKYLSLFYSYFPDVPFKFYDAIRIIEKDTTLLRPVLYIESVDSQKNLYVQILFSIPGSDPFFIRDNCPVKVAQFDNEAKEITVFTLDYTNVSLYFAHFEKLLKKYDTSGRGKNGYEQTDNLFIITQEIAKELIIKELGDLLAYFEILGEEKLNVYDIKRINPSFKFNLSSGIDFLEGGVDIQIDDETFSISDFLAQYKDRSYIVLKDNSRGIINKKYIDKLQRIFRRDSSKVRISFFDIPLLDDFLDEQTINNVFKAGRVFFNGLNQLKNQDVTLPPVNAELRHYQADGYKWLKYLYDNSFGGCLADDMGLGKTIQTIALLLYIYENETRPSLLVVPKSLIYNWKKELDKFAPSLSYAIYHGSDRELETVMKSQIVITTYETIRNDIEQFQKVKFAVGILDESQKIKNIHSNIARSIHSLDVEKRFALSGTPVENHAGELYSLFRFLNPSMFGSKAEFYSKYLTPIQKDNDQDVLRELKRKIYPFILRRLKADVLKDLPEKIEQEIYVEMSDAHRVYYEERRNFYYTMLKTLVLEKGAAASQISIFQALSELRQIASMPEMINDKIERSAKRDSLIEQLRDVIDNGHKALVFANYLGIIELISEDLENSKIQHTKITGATGNRQEIVEHFQNSNECKVLLMTLKAGGVGLNLTSADYVFIFDPWWNSAAENQAIDRAHRIGQTQTVFSYKMITSGTIEEKMLELQKKKNALVNSLVDSDNTGIKSLDENDIEFMFGV